VRASLASFVEPSTERTLSRFDDDRLRAFLEAARDPAALLVNFAIRVKDADLLLPRQTGSPHVHREVRAFPSVFNQVDSLAFRSGVVRPVDASLDATKVGAALLTVGRALPASSRVRQTMLRNNITN
jgi:hypothetical protein